MGNAWLMTNLNATLVRKSVKDSCSLFSGLSRATAKVAKLSPVIKNCTNQNNNWRLSVSSLVNKAVQDDKVHNENNFCIAPCRVPAGDTCGIHSAPVSLVMLNLPAEACNEWRRHLQRRLQRNLLCTAFRIVTYVLSFAQSVISSVSPLLFV